MNDKEPNPHEGHRDRLREALIASKEENISEHQLLEALLFYSLPRIDTNKLAHTLLNNYASLEGVFNTDYHELMKIKGIGKTSAQYLNLLGKTIDFCRNRTGKKVRYIFGEADTSEYLRSSFEDMSREYAYMIYLDGRYTIKRRELLFEGSCGSVDINIGEVIKKVVKHEPKFCVFAHNHPSGVAAASQADRETTHIISSSLKMMGIVLHDSVIITEHEQYSMMSCRKISYVK